MDNNINIRSIFHNGTVYDVLVPSYLTHEHSHELLLEYKQRLAELSEKQGYIPTETFDKESENVFDAFIKKYDYVHKEYLNNCAIPLTISLNFLFTWLCTIGYFMFMGSKSIEKFLLITAISCIVLIVLFVRIYDKW